MREDDRLFDSIVMYDGSDPSIFEWQLDDINQVTRMTNRSLRKELMEKSAGVVHQTLSMIDHHRTDDAIITKLGQDFSLLSTMNRAREELRLLVQPPNQLISMYIHIQV